MKDRKSTSPLRCNRSCPRLNNSATCCCALLPVQVKLRFAGWDARWDEWHKLDEDRIRLLVQPPKAAGAGKGRKAIGAVGIGKGLRGVKRKVWAGHGGSDVSKPNKPLNKAKVDPEVQKKIAAVLEKKAKKAKKLIAKHQVTFDAIDALTKAEQLFLDQTDSEGKPILLTPAALASKAGLPLL